MATTKEGRVLLALAPAEAAQRVLAAIQAQGWVVKTVDSANSLIEATTNVSLASWGENLSIRLTGVEGGTDVTITSARLKTNITAAGRNRKNVEALVRQLSA